MAQLGLLQSPGSRLLGTGLKTTTALLLHANSKVSPEIEEEEKEVQQGEAREEEQQEEGCACRPQLGPVTMPSLKIGWHTFEKSITAMLLLQPISHVSAAIEAKKASQSTQENAAKALLHQTSHSTSDKQS